LAGSLQLLWDLFPRLDADIIDCRIFDDFYSLALARYSLDRAPGYTLAGYLAETT